MLSISKTTSLQAWNKLIEKYFNKKLRIEDRKDRESIFNLMDDLGLVHEQLIVLDHMDLHLALSKAVKILHLPYWISATPLPGNSNLDRLTLLNISTLTDGVNFLDSIKHIDKYKILVMSYATNTLFKGSALVSTKNQGIVEFVNGDNHLKLIEGKSFTDPMLFESEHIIRYSKSVGRKYQTMLWKLISNHKGHFEFQYGKLKGKRCISFIDYNDEIAYENINSEYELLKKSLGTQRDNPETIFGLVACPGFVKAKCSVILSSDLLHRRKFTKGNILVTDITSPELTPYMAKASGIITDLGGVTSHAAIVCREMKIPCICGSKDATKRLKNNDIVVLDANNGVVRKLVTNG